MSASIQRKARAPMPATSRRCITSSATGTLAMAAYDWGPGYVQRSVMRTGYADYWELYKRNALPQETKNYVPGIIAAIIMAKNPKQYGLEGLVPDPAIVSDTVNIEYAVDLRLVADVTNASVPEIVGLNPSLLRMTTPRDASFRSACSRRHEGCLPQAHPGRSRRQAHQLALSRRAHRRIAGCHCNKPACAAYRHHSSQRHSGQRHRRPR